MNQPQQCTKCGSCLELRDETEISPLPISHFIYAVRTVHLSQGHKGLHPSHLPAETNWFPPVGLSHGSFVLGI